MVIRSYFLDFSIKYLPLARRCSVSHSNSNRVFILTVICGFHIKASAVVIVPDEHKKSFVLLLFLQRSVCNI